VNANQGFFVHILINWLPIFNPLASLWTFRPYRDALMAPFKKATIVVPLQLSTTTWRTNRLKIYFHFHENTISNNFQIKSNYFYLSNYYRNLVLILLKNWCYKNSKKWIWRLEIFSNNLKKFGRFGSFIDQENGLRCSWIVGPWLLPPSSTGVYYLLPHAFHKPLSKTLPPCKGRGEWTFPSLLAREHCLEL
jgi:hypothetical protein